MKGRLYFGDNPEVLRKRIPDESVDLIYLDPPFNSGTDYAIASHMRGDGESEAQTLAFEDTWRWGG
jgi:16S rRNA G966 N2-methylase RsmD